MRLAITVVAACILLSGCIQPDLAVQSGSVALRAPVVIAVIDTGANFYLPTFAKPGPAYEPPVPARVLQLSQSGSYEQRVEQDADLWASVEKGRLYEFSGTRLLGITFAEGGAHILDQNGHGTATTYVAARDAPDAVIVVVQALGFAQPSACGTPTSCLLHPSYWQAIEWAANQTWIDIISFSFGPAFSMPDSGLVHEEAVRILAATRAAASSGKLVVTAGGNGGIPTTQQYSAGPPWVICVGGAEPERAGEAVENPKGGIDVLSNMSVESPRHDSLDGTFWMGGTSFAAPSVAGTLATALKEIREQAPTEKTDAEELRNALNATAKTFSATSWDPSPLMGRSGLPHDLVSWANMPILVQPQMGWGYVNASLAPEIARRVLEQDFAIPAEKNEASVFQPAWQRAREEYWANWR
ncbi:MAG TPA: S8/S53 family peptidase [Candidatus Thermoplasmatota archaeon]|nr:S8/S53 family peptidase [Candidatus Thermoplasmatota archaeon]